MNGVFDQAKEGDNWATIRFRVNAFDIYFMRGFVLARRGSFGVGSGQALLFRQKDPKPCSPVRGPSGASASAPNHGGCATRSGQTVLAKDVDSGLRLRRAQRDGY